MAFRSVGKQFVLRTIFGASVLSLFIGLLTPLFPESLVQSEPFMSVLIGAILCGIGIGLCFTHNGSSGGTDIIAAMVSKHSNVSVGRTMLYTDFCIISSSYFLIHRIDTVVFGFVVLVVMSLLCDMIIKIGRAHV